MRYVSFVLTGMALFAVFCQAEFLRIEQDFATMDCASCATFVENKLAKNAGVEKVTIDAKKGLLTVILKPGNNVKYSQVRDFVQQSGYTPKEGRVVARGTPRMKNGLADFEMPEIRETIRIKDDDTVLREYINRRVEAGGKMTKVESKGVMIDIFVVLSAKPL